MKIPKPPKALSIKRLRAKCDKLFSQACFKKWGNKCPICGREATATHHFIPKSISAYLRYEVLNGVPLDYICHIIRIHSQGDPQALEAIIKVRGATWYEGLKALKREGEGKGGLNTVGYYKKIIEQFKIYLEL
jgi:hypothetical protein